MASHTVDWRQDPPAELRGGAVAIGNFDGVHRGHAALIQALRQQANQVGGPAVALTFDPHPLMLLRPGQPLPVLTIPADRAELLHRLGADHILTLRITPEFLELPARDFFHRVLIEQLAVAAVVEGQNFRFGKDREGESGLLASLCQLAGLHLTLVPPQMLGAAEVSSSRIRGLLLGGDVAGAGFLLGRPYRLRGLVGTGQGRGRTLGFPTANLEQIPTVLPANGVYAARVCLEDGGLAWPGAVHVGPNPTFGENARKVEIHLVGYSGELVGRSLAIDFLDRLRDTRPFGNAEELIAQLQRDVESARVCFQRAEEEGRTWPNL